MAVKNKTRYAILGVLSMKPCSGYDIKKFCDKTISYFWNENFGHIYPVLKELQREGLIQPETPDENNRRKVYAISEEGRKEFQEWLLQPVEYQPVRSELLLKLAFGCGVPMGETIKMIEEVKARHVARLEQYILLEKSYVNSEKANKDPRYIYLLAPLRYGIASSEATIHWCDETIKMIESSLEV